MQHIEHKRQAGISLLKLKTERLFDQLPELIKHIPLMTEEQLLQALIRAEHLADFAFLVRGACASELRKRSVRLPGGRGKRDKARKGVQSKMEELAKKIGTGRKTLETDARIIDTFFTVINETTLEQMPPLAREYYVIALSAPDPLAAIKWAIERCPDPSFSLRRFRAEVHLLKAVGNTNISSTSSEYSYVLNVHLSAEVGQLISEIIAKMGMTKSEIVAEAIRMLHTSLSKSPDLITRASKSSQLNAHTYNDKQLELKM